MSPSRFTRADRAGSLPGRQVAKVIEEARMRLRRTGLNFDTRAEMRYSP